MKSTYTRAISYVKSYCPARAKDICHTAFIKHYNKHGTNLFDQNIYTVFRWVKNVWFNELRSNIYQRDGKRFNRQFYTIDESPLDNEFNAICPVSKTVQPDQELITKEFYQELFRRVDNYKTNHITGWSVHPIVLRKLIQMMEDGYKSAEICEEMNISPQTLHHYKKKLQKIIKQMEMKSPFNGDYTKITKKITRKTFENNEQYKDYKYDPEAGCDENEHYQTVYNGVDFILIREKND